MSCMQETAHRAIQHVDIGINRIVPTICICAGTFGSLVNVALRQCIASSSETLLDGPLQILSIRWANECQNSEKQDFISIEPFQIASFIKFLQENDCYFDRWFPSEYNLELIQHTPENRLRGRLGLLFDLWLKHNFVEAVQTALDRVKLIDWCERIETDFINLFVIASTGDSLSSGIFWDLCLLLPHLLEAEEIKYKLNGLLAFGDILALNNRSKQQSLNANTHAFLTELYYYCVEAERLKAEDAGQESDNITNDTPFSELFLPFHCALDTFESPSRFCDNIYIITKRNAAGFTLDSIERYAQMAANFIALNVDCQCYEQIENNLLEEDNLLKSFCIFELSRRKNANIDIEHLRKQATPFFSSSSSNAESFSFITIDEVTEADNTESSASAELKEECCPHHTQLLLSVGDYNKETLKNIQKYRSDYKKIEKIGGYPFINKQQEDIYGWQVQKKGYKKCEVIVE